MYRSKPFLAALFLALGAQLLIAADWPRFRGPDGAGVSDESGLPSAVGPNRNVAWQLEVPFGRSSPIVAAGTVYMTAADSDYLWTLAIDGERGVERWRRSISRTRHTDVYPANDTASPTPTSDGEAVFSFFPDFGVVAYEADGNERWRVPFEPFRNHYGLAASPVLAGDAVVVVCDQQGGSFIVALDKATGKARWRVERPRGPGFATPLVIDGASGPIVLVLGSVWLDAYEGATGKLLWSQPGAGADSVASPAHGDGRLYLLSGGGYELPGFDTVVANQDADGDRRIDLAEWDKNEDFAGHHGYYDEDGDGYVTELEWLHAVDLVQTDGFGLVAYALREATEPPGERLWVQTKSLGYIPSPLLYRGVLYSVRGGGILASYDPVTGELLKRGRIEGAMGEYYPSLIAGDGKLYAASNDGSVAVIRAGEEWELLDVGDLDETIDATPAIAGGRLYVRSRNTLWAFAEGAEAGVAEAGAGGH